ncbi:MAG: CDP-diacylglycerol--serine O-phosphatidyltransferase [Chitinophagales bacterium]|nr:CDP-diacylglycerol--serine O-phosphatidyltransferase [Chitinophagales bacterium]
MKRYIPSAITSLNLIAGFTAIMIGDFFWSPILLLMSFVFDSLDGFVARLFNAQSEFGKQLDSIADVISFGVAPAYLYSLYSPDQENLWFTISAISCIVVCGAIRLAKFNITPSLPYFMGLPIPANAMFFIGVILAIQNESQTFINFFDSKINYFLTPVFMGLMMVSFNIHMFSTKGMTSSFKDNIFQYLMVILAILFVIIFKYESVSYIVLAYIGLSIISTISKRKTKQN